MYIQAHKRTYRTSADNTIQDLTGQYRTTHDQPFRTIQDQTRPNKTKHTNEIPYRAIPDHRRTYKSKQVYTKPKRAMFLSLTKGCLQNNKHDMVA